jgi:hypothetical protein
VEASVVLAAPEDAAALDAALRGAHEAHLRELEAAAHPRSEAEGCATEAALAEAREARWGAEYAADSAAEEAEKAIAALSCALVEAERQRDEAQALVDEWVGARDVWMRRTRVAEAALADTRDAPRSCAHALSSITTWRRSAMRC